MSNQHEEVTPQRGNSQHVPQDVAPPANTSARAGESCSFAVRIFRLESRPSLTGPVAREVRYHTELCSEAEATLLAKNWSQPWTHRIEVGPATETEQAEHYLTCVLAEKVRNLIEKELDETANRFHLVSGSLVAGVLKEAVDEAVGPFYEDDSPQQMGWVGSDGRP